MSTTYKYQEQFSADLAAKWLAGQRSEVRITIRQLKNKAQAAYIAAAVALNLFDHGSKHDGNGFVLTADFVNFIHPNY